MWEDEVTAVAAARRTEIEADLDRTRHELAKAVRGAKELERRVAVLEHLCTLAASGHEPGTTAISSELTLHEAMTVVLRERHGGLARAGDLAEEINRRGLYRMRDGRPVEAQQIHARVGHYSHLFEKEGTFIKLASN